MDIKKALEYLTGYVLVNGYTPTRTITEPNCIEEHDNFIVVSFKSIEGSVTVSIGELKNSLWVDNGLLVNNNYGKFVLTKLTETYH